MKKDVTKWPENVTNKQRITHNPSTRSKENKLCHHCISETVNICHVGTNHLEPQANKYILPDDIKDFVRFDSHAGDISVSKLTEHFLTFLHPFIHLKQCSFLSFNYF